MYKKELKKMIKQIENGEELRINNSHTARYISRMLTHRQREMTFIGHDRKNRTTLIKRF